MGNFAGLSPHQIMEVQIALKDKSYDYSDYIDQCEIAGITPLCAFDWAHVELHKTEKAMINATLVAASGWAVAVLLFIRVML